MQFFLYIYQKKKLKSRIVAQKFPFKFWYVVLKIKWNLISLNVF